MNGRLSLNPRAQRSARVARSLGAILLIAAGLVPLDAVVAVQPAGATTCAAANLGITALHDQTFYADFSPSPPSLPNLAGHYAGYRVTNSTGSALNGAWVQLSNFTGGVVALAPGQASSAPLGDLATSASGLSYFYLSASSATAVAQAHTISVYDRRPDLAGAVELCNTSFSYTSVTNTTQAAANKVTVATATSNPPGLGAIMTMTVTGDTGTIGSGSASDPKGFDMTPAAVATGASAWTPGAYRLLSASLKVDLTGGGATNHADLLHYTFTDPSSSSRTYTATYQFMIVGTTSVNTAMTPIQEIASGTQIKHTDMSAATYSAILPIQPISNTTTLAKTVNPTAITTPGATVTYTVTATNSSGTQSATLDDFTDTPGVGGTYVAGTSKYNGVAIADPAANGGALVWVGSWAIPAGSTGALTYDVAIVSGIATVSNSVVGHIGSTVIDTTTTTSDSSPATSRVDVAAAPKINLLKSVSNRLDSSDQFTVAIKNGASTVATATTSGGAVSAATGSTSVSSGTTYTLSDAMAAGSASTIAQYSASISCSNSKVGSTTTLPSGIGTSFTVTPLAGDVISCTFTNASKPQLTLLKTVGGRINSADQFTVGIMNGASTVASATTSGAGTSATTAAQALTSGTTYTLTDAMAAGSVSAIGAYASSISCTNTAGGSATTLPSGSGTSKTITPANGDVITCTYTNTPPAPTLNLTKSIASRVVAADQFTVTIAHGATTDASATTSGVGTTAATGATTLTGGTTYTLSDVMAAGSSSALSDYVSSISCTNSTVGSGTTLPSGAGTSFSVTPVGGDVISCTITNTAKPHVTLIKSVASRVNSADQFTVNIAHGATTDASTTTAGAGVSATTGSTALTAATAYTLGDAMAAGSVSAIGAYSSSITCSNTNGSSSTTLPSGAGTSFSLTPANGDNITCTITNTAKPHLTLIKSVTSRANAADQFTVKTAHGATTDATATTAGAGTTATTGITTLTGGTTYTLTDAMAAGSSSVIGQYASSISCSNTNGSSSTVLPSGSGTSFSVTPANGDVITCTFTNVAGTATLGLVKTASPNTNVTLGATVTYTYAVTNTGSLPLTNVNVTDPHAGLSAISCAPAQGSTLASGATMSCTAAYTVTQADIHAGSIVNTGTVTGKDPSNNTITKTAGATVTAAQAASLGLTKSASPSTNVVTGNVVTYTLSGTNTGTVALHNVSVTDPMAGLSAITCIPAAPATLTPDASISCTATYTATQANVDAGSFSNTATISGLNPSDNTVSASAAKTVTALQTATFSLTKTASPNSGVIAGTVVTYTINAQNTGTVTLHTVNVTDPTAVMGTCTPAIPVATLAPNATISCTATHTETQAEVDAGSFVNTATVNGLDPINNPVTKSASAIVTADATATLGLTKTASQTSGLIVGDTITYTLTGTNTGAVSIHNVTVTDPMVGLSPITCTPAQGSTLAPGATITCTATYTVTQVDVDAGSISNTATINGLDPSNNPVTKTAGATVTTDQTASLSFTKLASPSSGVVTGDTVTYSFAGLNDGNVTLSNVNVTDPMAGLGPITCVPAQGSNLAPGDTINCSAAYTVTQANVDAGSFSNTATVTGTPPTGPDVTKTASATVNASVNPQLNLVKTASPSANVTVGQTITYTFSGTNTGTTTLHGVGVTDPMAGLSAIACTPAAPATLTPGAPSSCTATYTVTQADVDNGQFTNTATIDGLDPNGNPVTNTASATVTASQAGSLTLTKTASPDHGVVAGDIVTYTFNGQNTGNVTMTNALVFDPMAGLSPITCTPAQFATLAPAATIACSANYTVTQADVDAGSIVNAASVSGNDPNGFQKFGFATATVLTQQGPSLSLTKTATPNSGVVVGDGINYTFDGTNNGTVTLHNVTVGDPMTGLSAVTCTPAQGSTLAPGATISCTAMYVVTQNDVDTGSIVNWATINGFDPGNSLIVQSASATVTADTAAGISLTKTASPTSSLFVGNIVTYTMTAANTGAVSLSNVTITDPMAGLSALSCIPSNGSNLNSGASMVCTATYTVTQADVNAGQISNTATVSGTPPTGPDVTDSATTTVLAGQTASLALVKTASPTSGATVGDTIAYSFDVTNNGTVSVTNVNVSDPMVGLSAITCTPAQGSTLTPNATMHCDATYTVTQADVNAGQIVNTATADGTDPVDNPVTTSASATVTTTGAADITLAKKLVDVTGSVATWDITVTNAAATPFPGPLTVTDPLTAGLAFVSASGAGWTCSGTSTITCVRAGTLAVGASSTLTVVTTITGNGPITNIASTNVEGKTVSAQARYTPSGGFAFTGTEAQRLGLLGLLAVLGGWFLMAAARRRREDEAVTVEG